MQLGPRLKPLTTLDQFVIAGGQLPDPVGSVAGVGLKGHDLFVVGVRLEVIQLANRRNRVLIGGMLRNVVRNLAVDEHLTPVLQAVHMLLTVLDHGVVLSRGSFLRYYLCNKAIY